jgi:thiol-disulfide isomerase/thioredoxin
LNARLPVAVAALLAALAGVAWMVDHFNAGTSLPRPQAAEISPDAFHASSLPDLEGRPQSFGQYAGKFVVLNFWATWCAPCREEIPGFVRAQSRFGKDHVQFIGAASDERAKVAAFGSEFAVNYPLLADVDGAMALSRRFGNRLGVLPHTVILGPAGEVVANRIGPFTEAEITSILEQATTGMGAKSR